MTVTVASKTKTFVNNTANDAVPVNSEFAALFNNDSLIAVALNALTDGTATMTGTKFLNMLIRLGSSTKTIASGVVVPDKSFCLIDTEAAAAADDCRTITANGIGQLVTFRAADTSHVVTFKQYASGSDNIYMADGKDYVLNSDKKAITFYNDTAGNWIEIARTVEEAPDFETQCIKNPIYASAATTTFYTGTSKKDSTTGQLIKLASDITVNLSSSGAAGLDTGSEASSTHYYFYLIGDSTGTNSSSVVASATDESKTGTITLPSGYDLKAQLPCSVYNDSSSDIIPWYMRFKMGLGCQIIYDILFDNNGDCVTNKLYVTTSSTTFTDVDVSDFVSTISERALLHVQFFNTANQVGFIRQKGASHDGFEITNKSAMNFAQMILSVLTDTSQVVQYKAGTTGQDTTINVYGFEVTKVA